MIAAAAVAAGFTLILLASLPIWRLSSVWACDYMILIGAFLVAAGCVALVAA